jgi:hypothetical protein
MSTRLPITKRRRPRAARSIPPAVGFQQLKRQVKQEIRSEIAVNLEHKYFPVNYTNTAILTTPVLISLSDIPQGDTAVTRDGSAIRGQFLEVYFRLAGFSSLVASFRLIFFVWLDNDSTAPTAGDVLYDGVSVPWVSILNHYNRRRYRVLADFFLPVSTVASQTFHQRLRYTDILMFTGTGTGVAGINKVYALFVSGVSTTGVDFELVSALHYTDA